MPELIPELSLVQRIVVWALPVLLAITLHEVAHGWAARALGDPTAWRLGRLSLNPLRHVDPLGTVVVPALLLLFSPVVFGWARPVPVTWENLRRPRRDMAWVAAAGPAANLAMAVLWALAIKLGLALPQAVGLPLVLMGSAGVLINGVLMVLNLLPIPPLDGGRIAVGLLPGRAAAALDRLEPYGMFVVLALALFGGLGALLRPPLTVLLGALGEGLRLPVQWFFAAVL